MQQIEKIRRQLGGENYNKKSGHWFHFNEAFKKWDRWNKLGGKWGYKIIIFTFSMFVAFSGYIMLTTFGGKKFIDAIKFIINNPLYWIILLFMTIVVHLLGLLLPNQY